MISMIFFSTILLYYKDSVRNTESVCESTVLKNAPQGHLGDSAG